MFSLYSYVNISLPPLGKAYIQYPHAVSLPGGRLNAFAFAKSLID